MTTHATQQGVTLEPLSLTSMVNDITPAVREHDIVRRRNHVPGAVAPDRSYIQRAGVEIGFLYFGCGIIGMIGGYVFGCGRTPTQFSTLKHSIRFRMKAGANMSQQWRKRAAKTGGVFGVVHSLTHSTTKMLYPNGTPDHELSPLAMGATGILTAIGSGGPAMFLSGTTLLGMGLLHRELHSTKSRAPPPSWEQWQRAAQSSQSSQSALPATPASTLQSVEQLRLPHSSTTSTEVPTSSSSSSS